MANVQSAGSTGVRNDRATAPTGSPTAPLPPNPATRSWTTASTTTVTARERSVVEDRRTVSGMCSFSARPTPAGHSAFHSTGSFQQQDVQPPGGDDRPRDDHGQEVGEVPEEICVHRTDGQRPHQ